MYDGRPGRRAGVETSRADTLPAHAVADGFVSAEVRARTKKRGPAILLDLDGLCRLGHEHQTGRNGPTEGVRREVGHDEDRKT